MNNHGFADGEKVIYKEGNANLAPLKHNERYSIQYLDINKFSLSNIGAEETITLTTQGGMNQKFIREPSCVVERKPFESEDSQFTTLGTKPGLLVSGDSYTSDVFSLALEEKVEKDSTIRIVCQKNVTTHQYSLQPNRLFGRCMGNTIKYDTNMHFNTKKNGIYCR
jgi:hypothetical protein